MIKRWCFGVFLFGLVALQAQTDTENTLYSTLDQFLENPTANNLAVFDALHLEALSPSSSDEAMALTILMCNKGFYENKFGQQQAALESYEKAWSLFQEYGLTDYDIVEFCLKPMGNLYTIIGDYEQAENHIKHYFLIAEQKQDVVLKTAAVINLSVVYHSTGRHQTAISMIEDLINKHPGVSADINLLNNLASNYIASEQFAKAKTVLYRCLKNAEQHNNAQSLANIYKNISLVHLNEQDLEQARHTFEKAKTYFLQQKNPIARDLAKLHLEHASILSAQGLNNEALQKKQAALSTLIPKHNEDKLPARELLYAESTLIDILDMTGILYTNKGLLDEAINAYELSFDVDQMVADQSVFNTSKVIQQNNHHLRTEKCLALLHQQFQQSKDPAIFEKALQLSEQAKATVLKQEWQFNIALQKTDDTLQNAIRFLKKEQASVTNQLLVEQLKPKFDVAIINQLEQQRSKNAQELRQLLNQVSQQLKNGPTNQTDLSLTFLQSYLKEHNATLVALFYGRDTLYRFQLSNNVMDFKAIQNTTEVTTTVRNLLRYFEGPSAINNDIQGYIDNAYHTFDLLKLKDVEPGSNLIIVPDGLFNFVPFEALLTQKTEAFQYAQFPFLIKEVAITYNHSIGLYFADAEKPKFSGGILGIFPVFEQSPQPLKHSVKEAEAIKKHYKGNYLFREKATKQAFLENAETANMLHLSTHASWGNNVAPAHIQFYDATLYLPELYQLNLNAELVTLSACETGIGLLKTGEGAMSIARGFKASGTKNTLLSLWKVNDLSTSQVMERFYQGLSNKKSITLANQFSKIDYLSAKTISNPKKSPYYWSGFTHYGTLQDKEPQVSWWLYVLAALGLLIIALIWKRKFLLKNS